MSDRLPLLLLLAVVAGLAVGSMWDDTATADEGAHIASGLLKLQEGRVDFYATQAPLAEVVEAVPVAMAGYRVPPSWTQLGNRPWAVGRLLLYGAGYDPHRILVLARLPVIAMFLALVAVVFAFVSRTTGSGMAGLAAATLTGFCPTLLAHGRLATVDMALAFFGFLATALLVELLRKPSTALAIGTGLATALALASKVSGAVLVPFFGLVVIVWFVRERRLDVRALATAAATSVVSFAAVYLALARSFDVTLPFREYLGAAQAVNRYFGDRYTLPQFLLGDFSQRGWPHYNLVALAVKTPLPALLLALLAIVGSFRRWRFETIVCWMFAALFLAVSAFSSLNLGIRHVLPILPFVYAATAIVLYDATREARRSQLLVASLLAWHVVTAVIAYPSYIAYFNPLIGGHRNADRVLIDSNLDWGQDLHRLATWSEARNVAMMRVHYFGAGSVEHEFGARGMRWNAPRPQLLPKGWFAVSRHFYRLSFDPHLSRVNYDDYLAASHAKFVTSIGGSIDVYRVE